MKPTVGDIFVVYTPRLAAYTAVQVTALKQEGKDELACVLSLDWVGPELPDAAAVAAMKPIVVNFFFWKEHHVHVWAPIDVPHGFVHVGNRPPLLTEKSVSYSHWPTGRHIFSQHRWETIPQATRDLFKQTIAKEDRSELVTLGGLELRRTTQRLDTDRLRAVSDLAVFEALPILTSVNADAPVTGLFDFIRRRPFVYESQVTNHGQRVVDVRGARLSRFVLDVTGVQEVYLNDELETLSLLGEASPGLRIHAEADGRWLHLHTKDTSWVWSGLDALDELHVHSFRELDAGSIVRRFPKLTELRATGAPGNLRDTAELGALTGLRVLMFNEVFGMSPEEFPGPEHFPDLGRLWLTSLPADVAASVKKAYKAAAQRGVDVSVRQPRKPEWLAENLDNPFRHWDGEDNIPPAKAKKAAALYRQARSAALAATPQHGGSPSALVSALTPIVKDYTEGFNKLDARHAFIFTVEREHIHDALMGILDAVDGKLRAAGDASVVPLDRDALVAVMDSVRDF
ncbi:gliding motility protein [Myxococcus sp. XM-1-1-1]|jgi:hypothetical protein|uniref:gliding motility protein n=1 Tax=Myxococcus sp. XM-1-1-1 TaxID=2874602 RepID=UPI001CBF9FF9|nr:gliding motility protein [Myxococcus sp. XM-1-1-1]MBZ4406813.1 gliding motility protein [Myxococcus sp. XM-1-1-1]